MKVPLMRKSQSNLEIPQTQSFWTWFLRVCRYVTSPFLCGLAESHAHTSDLSEVFPLIVPAWKPVVDKNNGDAGRKLQLVNVANVLLLRYWSVKPWEVQYADRQNITELSQSHVVHVSAGHIVWACTRSLYKQKRAANVNVVTIFSCKNLRETFVAFVVNFHEKEKQKHRNKSSNQLLNWCRTWQTSVSRMLPWPCNSCLKNRFCKHAAYVGSDLMTFKNNIAWLVYVDHLRLGVFRPLHKQIDLHFKLSRNIYHIDANSVSGNQ